MNILATYIAQDELGNTYKLHKVPAKVGIMKPGVQVSPLDDQSRLVAADGREVQIFCRGVYGIFSAAAVVRITCCALDAP